MTPIRIGSGQRRYEKHEKQNHPDRQTGASMTKVIGVIQVKGGAGRSTLSTNLAGELSKIGKTVLIDCDLPQGTAASWYAVRVEQGKASSLVADTASTHKGLVTKIEQHRDADFIVLDSPPRIAEMTRATTIMSDLCLIPVGASKAEIWATGDIIELLTEAQKVKTIAARLVWTRYRGQTKLAQELSELADQELGIPALTTKLGMRVAYMEALGDGLTVAELPDQTARTELQGLVNEVIEILR